MTSHGYRGLRRRNFPSRLFSGGFCIYRRGWHREHVRGPHRESTRQGRAPRGWARPPPSWGPWGSPPVTLRSSIFYIFSKKLSVDFHRIPRTFISAQKNTTVVLLKTASICVSSNQIVPKSYKTIVNMALILHKLQIPWRRISIPKLNSCSSSSR